MLFQKSREVGARKLRALVRVENLRLRDPERFPQRLQTEAGVQRDRKLPGQDIAAVPIHDDNQINEAVGQTNVGDVADPGLIRTVHRNPFQKIGIDLVIRPAGARARLGIDGLKPHPPHQALDALAIDREARFPQTEGQLPGAKERMLRVLLVQPAHQLLVQPLVGCGKIIEGRT